MPEVNLHNETATTVKKSRANEWINKEFSASALLFWIKGKVSVDYRAVHIVEQNTVFGLIPAGSSKQNIPLKNITDVQLNTSYKISRFIWGILFILAGLASFVSSPLMGFITLLIGVALFLNGILTQFVIEKGGSGYLISVPFFNKADMMEVQSVIEQALNTDADKTDQSLYHHRLDSDDMDDVQ